jgi:hypothetical protein
LIKYVRSKSLNDLSSDKLSLEFEQIAKLPANTIQKLHLLEVDGISALSGSELSDLSDNYKYFLWLYHKSQNAYNKGSTQIVFDSFEVKERCKSIADLCSKQIIKC